MDVLDLNPPTAWAREIVHYRGIVPETEAYRLAQLCKLVSQAQDVPDLVGEEVGHVLLVILAKSCTVNEQRTALRCVGVGEEGLSEGSVVPARRHLAIDEPERGRTVAVYKPERHTGALPEGYRFDELARGVGGLVAGWEAFGADGEGDGRSPYPPPDGRAHPETDRSDISAGRLLLGGAVSLR